MSMKSTPLLLNTALLVVGLGACSSMTKSKDSGTESRAAQKAASADSDLSEAQKEAKRQALLKMADETLKEVYAMDPKAKDKVEKAYAYAVFDDYIYNAVLYVAGKGDGVAFRNSTKAPEYMLMLRAGTGPGVGYTKFRQLLIIKNETTYKEMTTVGLDVEASANATFKVDDFGGSKLYAGSFNPYVDVYTITDAGVDLQANWGGVEYIKNPGLN
jgi:lipid-binding SYLF domain-containing protein